jgi:hypothetical protein
MKPRRRQRGRNDHGEVPQLHATRRQQHRQRADSDQRGRAEILDDDEQADRADRDERRHEPAPEFLDVVIRPRQPPCQEDHHRPLRHFRRLKLRDPHRQPSPRAVLLDADAVHQHQRVERDRRQQQPRDRMPDDRFSAPREPGVIVLTDDDEDREPDEAESQLLHPQRVPLPRRLARHVHRRRLHHDHAEAEQREDAKRKNVPLAQAIDGRVHVVLIGRAARRARHRVVGTARRLRAIECDGGAHRT